MLSLLILPQAPLHAQSEGDGPGRDPALPLLPPATVRTPAPDPLSPSFRLRLPVSPGTFGFPQLARAAGIIFSGTVTEIAHGPANAGKPIQTVAVTFRVETAIRGATPGDTLTISEWIGLWASGQRYRVGERVMLFLYPFSKIGLTSCVEGAMGRFPVDPAGRVLLSPQQLSAFRKDPVLGGKSHVRLSDFAWAVRQASEEE